MRGADVFVRTLLALGMGHYFSIPGNGTYATLRAIGDHRDAGLRYVTAFQEAPLVLMADGYARRTRRPAVVNLYQTPGVGNALGALYVAWEDKVPLLVTATNMPNWVSGRKPTHGTAEQCARMCEPLVKWSTTVATAEEIQQSLVRAYKVAMTPPMGPVFLGFPSDVFDADVEEVPVAVPAIPRPGRPDTATSRRIVEAIAAAQRPVMVVGPELYWNEAIDLAAQLAEHVAVPAVQEPFTSNRAFPPRHPMSFGPLRMSDELVADADLMVSLGAKVFPEDGNRGGATVPDGAQLVHVTDDGWELGKVHPPDIGVLGDVRAVLADLVGLADEVVADDAVAERVATRRHRLHDDRAQRSKAVAASVTEARADAEVLRLPAVADAVRRVCAERDDVVLINDGTSAGVFFRKIVDTVEPDDWFERRASYQGWGFPAAAGVQLAAPDRRVLQIAGDGGLLFSANGFWTAARHQLPVTVLVLNNQGWRGSVMSEMRDKEGLDPALGAELGFTFDQPAVDFLSLARAFDYRAQRVAGVDELDAALREGLSHDGPSLIEVPLSTEGTRERAPGI